MKWIKSLDWEDAYDVLWEITIGFALGAFVLFVIAPLFLLESLCGMGEDGGLLKCWRGDWFSSDQN